MFTFFLGTNPRLSASEIIAALTRLGYSYTVIARTSNWIRIDAPDGLPNDFIKILGGTIRISTDVASWPTMPSPDEVLSALAPLPAKWELGIGFIDMSQNIRSMGIALKKAARAHGSRLSFIEPRSASRSQGNAGGKFHHKANHSSGSRQAVGTHSSLLNAAQVIFNKLTHDPNKELIFLQHEGVIILMRSIAMQDIASYELRDTSRPARDAKVGLLPPKLAQIMINLALPAASNIPSAVYDPFCGMGTILQEAWLMNIKAFGTDISERMIEATTQNMEHLKKYFSVKNELAPTFLPHDVTNPNIPEKIYHENITVVTEPFLGTPLSRPLSPTEAEEFYASVTPLYLNFFMNMKSVLPKNGRILLLLPAPRVAANGKERFSPIPRTFLDEIAAIGYRKGQLIPKELSTSSNAAGTEEPLIYARPDAFIARELTLWERD